MTAYYEIVPTLDSVYERDMPCISCMTLKFCNSSNSDIIEICEGNVQTRVKHKENPE